MKYATPNNSSLPDYVLEKYCNRNGMEYNRTKLNKQRLKSDDDFVRTICDHIAGMTDQYALYAY